MSVTNPFRDHDQDHGGGRAPATKNEDRARADLHFVSTGGESQTDGPLSETLRALDDDLRRAISAHRIMLSADRLMRRGLDADLLLLGFSAQHIAELRRRAGDGGGYPQYAIQNIEQTIRMLRGALARHLAS